MGCIFDFILDVIILFYPSIRRLPNIYTISSFRLYNHMIRIMHFLHLSLLFLMLHDALQFSSCFSFLSILYHHKMYM